MRSEHTPAPWTWAHDVSYTDARNPDGSYVTKDIEGQFLALDPEVIEYAGCGTHAIAVSEANARLIASAPEMLSALMALCQRFIEPRELKQALKEARAVIAKAIGKDAHHA